MRLGFPYVLLAIALVVDVATWSTVSVADRSTHITVLLAAAAIVAAIQGRSRAQPPHSPQ